MAKQIQLTQGMSAFVDDEDYGELAKVKWQVVYCEGWYAKSWKLGYMHRWLLGNPPCKVDHRDHNGLNNVRSNLRLCDNAGNAQNRRKGKSKSGLIGVYFEASTGKWVAEITDNYRLWKIGRYDTREEAARMRDYAALICHGEFAVLNLPRT
jgi:hypothetical protein